MLVCLCLIQLLECYLYYSALKTALIFGSLLYTWFSCLKTAPQPLLACICLIQILENCPFAFPNRNLHDLALKTAPQPFLATSASFNSKILASRLGRGPPLRKVFQLLHFPFRPSKNCRHLPSTLRNSNVLDLTRWIPKEADTATARLQLNCFKFSSIQTSPPKMRLWWK